MDSKNKSDQKINLGRIGLRQKTYVFIICLCISAFIWILIKTSKEYSEVLPCRVSFTNIPAGQIIVNDPDTLLTLHLKSKGFRLVSKFLFHEDLNIDIDIGSRLQKKKNSNGEYFIVSSDINQVVGKQAHLGNTIISISPDTLFFRLEKVFSKKVPVKSNLKLFFAQQYELADSIKLSADSVVVSGPKKIIDTIRLVETVNKTISGIKSNQTITLEFDKKYSLLKLNIVPAAERVLVPVDKFTESTAELPVTITNNINKYVVRTFPEKVKITYLVSLSKFKNVKPSMFVVSADISKAIASKSKKLKAELTKRPDFVKVSKIEPDKIEYILLK